MDMTVLRSIANATAANTHLYVTANEGKPLLDAGFITVDFNNKDAEGKVAATVTPEGAKALTNGNGAANHTPPMSQFAVNKGGIELPKIERGFKKGQSGGGREEKYPFGTMEVGDFFFIANSAVSKGDALKTLGSAAGSANQRYSEGTGEHETVKRAKRGPDHKAVKGPDGKNVMEEVTVEKKRHTRKFTVRPVKANVAYGNFTAPADGAVVVRSE